MLTVFITERPGNAKAAQSSPGAPSPFNEFDDLVGLLKLNDQRRAIHTSEAPDDLKAILFEALDQP